MWIRRQAIRSKGERLVYMPPDSDKYVQAVMLSAGSDPHTFRAHDLPFVSACKLTVELSTRPMEPKDVHARHE